MLLLTPGPTIEPERTKSNGCVEIYQADIEVLANRITSRAGTLAVHDAQWASDMSAAGNLLKWMLAQGVPPTTAEIENGGR